MSFRLILRLLSMVSVALILGACNGGPPASVNPPSRYVRNTDSETVIVFVHGVFGDSVNTWKNGASYWPDLIKDDPDFNGTDIFVYQFPTSITNSFSIDELAENMRLQLRAQDVEARKRIIFLAHSMGGLVTRAYLLKNREVAKRTAFVQFFATPTTGSQLASYLTLISKNPQLRNMRLDISTEYLGDLTRQWLDADLGIPSYCAYEKQKTYGITVVTFESAAGLCNRSLDPIDSDHIGIVKPVDTNSTSYIVFKESFRQSGRRAELSFKKLAENTTFGATTMAYAKSVLGEPVWEEEDLSRFNLGDYQVFVRNSGEGRAGDSLEPARRNRIVGFQVENDRLTPKSTDLILGSPFSYIENGRRIGISDKPLGFATYADFGILTKLGSSQDPLSNPLFCAEFYSASKIGLCCRYYEAPGKAIIMRTWTNVPAIENWVPDLLEEPRKTIAQLANNDGEIARFIPDWKERTTYHCERMYPGVDVERLVVLRKDQSLGPLYKEVTDEQLKGVFSNLIVDGIEFASYNMGIRRFP